MKGWVCVCVFPIYRFVLPCFVPSQMVMNIRFLGFVDVTKRLFCDMRNEGFLSCNLWRRVVVFGCQSACVRSLCLWCCACLVEFWLLFRDASVDLHMCVGNGCARCCANPQDSSRCCFRHILSMLCHMFSDGSANCLRVFNRVDDETNESLFTLCHASWPMN